MNDFYCAIFQTLLNAFERDGNCSALCRSQNKQHIFPKPACVFLSNWRQLELSAQAGIWFDSF